jgi:nucleoside-diphosphate-sugar epimerase
MHYWAEYKLGFIALRLSGIYGLGMRYPLYIKPVIEGVVKGREINIGAVGDTFRDLIYVEDAARAMIDALEANSDMLTSRIFNIGSGILHSAFSIVNAVRELNPDAKIHVAGGITDAERIIQKSRGRLSVEKAKTQLGFEPVYSLEQGLGRYLSLYKSYLNHKNN